MSAAVNAIDELHQILGKVDVLVAENVVTPYIRSLLVSCLEDQQENLDDYQGQWRELIERDRPTKAPRKPTITEDFSWGQVLSKGYMDE
jgi:hypothetical protein